MTIGESESLHPVLSRSGSYLASSFLRAWFPHAQWPAVAID